MYIVFENKEDALNVADQEGQHRNLPHWNPNDIGNSRTITTAEETADGKWALNVTEYESLTEEQDALKVESVSLLPEESEV